MKTVVYNSPFVPPEWIAAHGLRPSWMRPRWAADGRLVDVIRGVCPFVRAFLHAALSDKAAAAAVMTTTCDQMRHGAGLLARTSDRPLFLLNVPSTWETSAVRQFYVEELQRLGQFLVQLGGESPSRDDLAETMLEYDRARSAVRAARARLSGRQFAEAVAALHQEPGAVCNTDVDVPVADGIPLALVGGPLLEKDLAILDLVEQAGGRLVLDATEGGERTMPAAFDHGRIRHDPLRELADAYFGTIPDAFRRPNNRLYEWLGHKLAARQVRGILFRRYVWCDTWHAELHRLRDWSPVPVLDLDVCHDDDGALSRTVGRLEAFLEMLR